MVADTLVGLWSAITAQHQLPYLAPPPPGPGAPVTSIRSPTATVALAVKPGHSPWDGTLPDHGTTIECSNEAELDRALHQLTTDPLRHRVKVSTIAGVDWPHLPAPPDGAPDQLYALLAWATGLQVGGHIRHHRLTVYCGITSFSVVHGHGHGHGLGLATTES